MWTVYNTYYILQTVMLILYSEHTSYFCCVNKQNLPLGYFAQHKSTKVPASDKLLIQNYAVKYCCRRLLGTATWKRICARDMELRLKTPWPQILEESFFFPSLFFAVMRFHASRYKACPNNCPVWVIFNVGKSYETFLITSSDLLNCMWTTMNMQYVLYGFSQHKCFLQ